MEFFGLAPPVKAVLDNRKNAEEAKIPRVTQTVLGLNDIIQTSTALDLVLLVDSTAGMAPFVEKTKEFVILLANQLKTWYPNIVFRVAWVCYYEIGSERTAPAATNRASRFIAKSRSNSQYTMDYCNFTENIGELVSFLDSVDIDKAGISNANRGCTDIVGGLAAVNDLLDWEIRGTSTSRPASGLACILDVDSNGGSTGFSQGTRVLFHIGDSPCHGQEFHSPNIKDRYPDGDPTGKDVRSILADLVIKKQIRYVFGKINYTTDVMVKRFNEIIGSLGGKTKAAGAGAGGVPNQLKGLRPVSAGSCRTASTDTGRVSPDAVVVLNTDGSPFKVGLLLYQYLERMTRATLSHTWSSMILLGTPPTTRNYSKTTDGNALAAYMVKRTGDHQQQLKYLEGVTINFSYSPIWDSIRSARVVLFPCYPPASVADILSPGTVVDGEAGAGSSVSVLDSHCLAYYPDSPPAVYFGKIKTTNTSKTLKVVPFYARGNTCRISKVMARHSYGATTAPACRATAVSARDDRDSINSGAVGGESTSPSVKYKETASTPDAGIVGFGNSIFTSFASLLTGASPIRSATMSAYKPAIHREIVVQQAPISSSPKHSLMEQYITRLACQNTARFFADEFNKAVSRVELELRQDAAVSTKDDATATVASLLSTAQGYPTIEFAEACLVRLPVNTNGEGSSSSSAEGPSISSRAEFDTILAAENDDGDPASDGVTSDPSYYRIQEDFLQVSARVRSKLADPITSVAFERYNSNSGYVAPFPTTSNPSVYSTGHTSNHEVVQAFSHWTHVVTGSVLMVVNCKGVLNKDRNCFQLTAPTIHSVGSTKCNYDGCGCNHGEVGFGRFYATHICNSVCKLLNIEYNIPRYDTGESYRAPTSSRGGGDGPGTAVMHRTESTGITLPDAAVDQLRDFDGDSHFVQSASTGTGTGHGTGVVTRGESGAGFAKRGAARQAPVVNRSSRYSRRDGSESGSDSDSDSDSGIRGGGGHTRAVSVGGRPLNPPTYRSSVEKPVTAGTDRASVQLPIAVSIGHGSSLEPARVSLFASTSSSGQQQQIAAARKVERRPQRPQRIQMEAPVSTTSVVGNPEAGTISALHADTNVSSSTVPTAKQAFVVESEKATSQAGDTKSTSDVVQFEEEDCQEAAL